MPAAGIAGVALRQRCVHAPPRARTGGGKYRPAVFGAVKNCRQQKCYKVLKVRSLRLEKLPQARASVQVVRRELRGGQTRCVTRLYKAATTE